MKKLLLTLITIHLSLFTLLAQTPQAFKYQTIARDNAGNIISNKKVSFRMSILQGSTAGPVSYEETDSATTNQFGLANLNIGMGSVVSGDFATINWESGLYFIKMEFDPNGGNSFTFMGTSQLLSVPYSLYSAHAKVADNIPVFPIKAALQATNLQAPFNNPETGMLVYNTDSAGRVPYSVVPGYYYNSGTPTAPIWVLLSTNGNNQGGDRKNSILCTTYQFGNCAGGNTTVNNNTAFGDQALGGGNITSTDNTAFGYYSLNSNTSGLNNTAVGSRALYGNSTGNYNTGVGYWAVASNSTGYNNTGIGWKALTSNENGYNNTATGMNSMSQNTYGYNNTAYGTGTLLNNISGANNTAIGYNALMNTKSAFWNTAIGSNVLSLDTSGQTNVGIGFDALSNNSSGSDNTATGTYSLQYNTTGTFNLANGSSALVNNSTGNYNTGIGSLALYSNTSGSDNAASGFRALNSNTSGYQNTAIGSSALYSNTTAYQNVAIGYQALFSNTGIGNTAEGYQAMYVNTGGVLNVAEGYSAMYSNSTGSVNTAIGTQALYYNVFGSVNTAIGFQAGTGYNFNYLQNTTTIGYGATTNSSNTIVLGNSQVVSIGGYSYWWNMSDARFKKNITEDVHGLDFILKLRPVVYNLDVRKLNEFSGHDRDKYDSKLSATERAKLDSIDESGIKQKEAIRTSGFLAQEVEQAAKEVNYDFDGVMKPANDKDHYKLCYDEFTVPIVKAIQEQQKMIDELKKEIDELKKQNQELKKQN